MRPHGFTLIVYAAMALAILAVLSGLAWKIRESGKDAVRVEWAEANRQARDAEAKQANTAAAKLEGKREKTRTIYKTLTREVDKIVDRVEYRNVCLDPDGLRLANCAILGKSADSCKPDSGVPATKPAN